ncbi:MAG: hypothetical protein QY309_03705 [Cyclobacteriaceae bacterium]|nr:MAG: hypothetical protein QY309_03705 [Cyclobacteriaceae bacterium]
MCPPNRIVFVGLLLLSLTGIAQPKKPDEKIFQLSLLPGLGTNGLHPGGFTNVFSVNLTSGYSKATLFLEVGVISNLNEEKTRGLQLAGLANLTGANAFAGLTEKEIREKIISGFEANLTGLQLSGLTNVVINNTFGGQLTGGVNISKGAMLGVQVAGLINQVNKYIFGVQVAGLSNVAMQSVDGVQLAGLSNYTDGELFGVQIGTYNRARNMEGVNSYDNNDPTGVQIGLVNRAFKMNGFQIGIINIARRSQGTQIGLINIYRKGKDVGTRDGTSIGLINIGDVGYAAMYANDIFLQNYELSTGNYFKNSRVLEDRFNKSVQNSLIYSRTSWQGNMWAMGYGLRKMYFIKSSMPGMGSFRFFSYGLDVQHINHGKSFSRELSLLVRPKILAGTRLSPKLHSIYVIASIDLNYYRNHSGMDINTLTQQEEQAPTSVVQKLWPGYSLGVMLR